MEAKTETSSRLLMQHTEEVVQCPSCDATLKPYEMAKHLEEEMEQLRQIQVPVIANGVDGQVSTTDSASSETRLNSEAARKPWTVFRKVQKNRQSRLKLRSRKRPQQDPTCPVCNLNFPQDEIQRHAEQCLRRSHANTNGRHTTAENSDDDSEDGGGEFEEYEWAGQKRIRASSLLPGGYASLGVGTVITNHNTDEDDEDLNVDEDDTQIYGPPQYAENDVIPPAFDINCPDEDHNVATYMRRLIAGSALVELAVTTDTAMASAAAIANNSDRSDQLISTTEKHSPSPHSIKDHSAAMTSKGQNYLQIIEALKAKLRHYENHVQNKFKCLICLDDYRNPAISVCCWHVHCEECWLRSLGARKLCPQCNLITSPKDLRRIYM